MYRIPIQYIHISCVRHQTLHLMTLNDLHIVAVVLSAIQLFSALLEVIDIELEG